MNVTHCVHLASALLCSALLTRPRVSCRAITSFIVGRPPHKSNFYCHPGRAGGTPMLLDTKNAPKGRIRKNSLLNSLFSGNLRVPPHRPDQHQGVGHEREATGAAAASAAAV